MSQSSILKKGMPGSQILRMLNFARSCQVSTQGRFYRFFLPPAVWEFLFFRTEESDFCSERITLAIKYKVSWVGVGGVGGCNRGPDTREPRDRSAEFKFPELKNLVWQLSAGDAVLILPCIVGLARAGWWAAQVLAIKWQIVWATKLLFFVEN